MKMSSAMLTNKKCHSHQWLISGLQMWMRAPKTVIQQMLPSPARHGDHWETVRMQEVRPTRKQGWPQIPEVHTKGTNSVSPEAYIFPYCRMLNSLTWYLIFDVQAACSLFCKLVYSLTFPASLELFYQSCWDPVSWARGTKHPPQIKYLSVFSLWL